MGRRRSATLRGVAGVHHVVSRLAYEGFHATVAGGGGAGGSDVLAGLPGSAATAGLRVSTTVCPLGFGGGGEGNTVACEWCVGKQAAQDAGTCPFVVLVDLKRAGEPPGVFSAARTRYRRGR